MTRRSHPALALVSVAALLVGSSIAGSIRLIQVEAANPCGPPVVSVIACENTLAGTPSSDWSISGSGDSTIQGFATDTSVNLGDTVHFKISTPASSYHLDILRMGYYAGAGARKVAAGLLPTAALPQNQPACLNNATTGLVDCGNWGESASWTVPSSAVSGVYFAHLVRNDTGGGSHIFFVVRNDASHSDLLYQTSDSTWQAYNSYGGNSLYTGGPGTNPGRAYKVSYNRPINNASNDSRNWIFNAEYQLIRFLEANGYDVSYTTDVDSDRRGSLIKQHKVFISSGHDEYWSGNQWTNVAAARDAGVNLAFFSGNSVFWKTRWENSIDATATPYRTLVSYKETHANAQIDPLDPPTWTGTWRDPRFSPPGDGDRPDNALKGSYYTVNEGQYDIQVPAADGPLRFWRNTSIAALAPGTVATLAPGAGTLGYEWDEDLDNGFRPAGLIDLSYTAENVPAKFIDYGHTVAPASAIHQLTLYRAPSGALVFSAGTVNWSYGLDDTNPNGKPPDVNMEQATVNLFADMGVQAFALLTGLVAATRSTDTAPPTSTITAPAAGANFPDGARVTVSGTASDSGGVVAAVEVSTDGGSTWHPATGRASWSYSWVAHGSPTTTIRSRAADDSGNLETPSAGVVVNVNCPCSAWGNNSPIPDITSDTDGSSVELGVKFRADTDGLVSGIRFYKGSLNTGTHIGNLWTATGTLLGSVTFTGETASGWQQANFTSPIAVFGNTTYVVSYFAPQGHYADNANYFFAAPPLAGFKSTDSPPLHLLTSGVDGPNGVYKYSSSSTFPASATTTGTNFWVDLVFNPNNGPPVVVSTVPAPGASGAAQTAAVSATFNKSIDAATLSFTLKDSGGNSVAAVVSYNGTTRVASLQPSASLAARASYTAQVSASDLAGHPMASPYIWSFTTAGPLTNGDFETGVLSPWVVGGVVPPIISTAKPHAGTYSALLGSLSGPEADGDSSLSQGITVPGGSPSLTFWYWTFSTDTLCSGANCTWDWIEAEVRSPTGSTLRSIFKLNSNSQAWTKVTFDMTPYAGQGVTLWFNVHLDGSSPPDDTAMYLDDIAVTGSSTVPGPPTNVAATAGNAQATVSWTAPASNGGSPITGYTVTSSPGGITASAGASATSAVVSPLVNGTTYTFTVTATNAVGSSSPSAPSNAVTPATAPGPPTNVTATAGNAQATVSWTAPASNGGRPITGYTVTSSPGGVTASAGASATSAVVTPLVNGTTYTFTVTATNAVGTSSASTPSNAIIPAAPPGPPTNVAAIAGNTQATVSWTAPASNGGRPITGYTVTSSPGGVTASAAAAASSAVVSPLVNGTTYTFTVTASNAAGTSSPSTPSNAVTPAAPPGPPTNVAASAGNAQATVSWTAPASNGGSPITGFTVTSSPGGVTASAGASATSAVVSPLVNGTTYSFTVTASNAIGTSSPSAPSNSVTPVAPTPPGPPGNVTATPGNAQATVSWTIPASNGGSPITGYTVTSSPGGVTASAGALATSAVVSALLNGTTYTFTVTATNAIGTSSPSAPSNAVTPAAPPGPPTNVAATAGNAQATVSWTAPASNGGSPISGYTVTSSPGGVTASAGPSATSAVVSPLVNGTTYTFTVTASNAFGTSSASAASNAVTPVAPPGPPTNVTATPGNGQATVSWTAPASNGGSPITGYTVTSSPGGITAGAGASATSTVVSPLVNGTGYTFSVTATNVAGTSSASAPSNAVTPTAPPGPPTNVAATGGNAQATVSWTAPFSNGGSPITGYTVTSSPGGVTASAGALATSAVVSPLVNGTTYTFTVTATNAVGTSSASAPSNPVTPATAPGSPTSVRATAGNAQATVSWIAPASDGGSPITGYTVTSSPGGVTASAGASATSSVVGPLVNGTAYTFTVTATNATGTGIPSAPSAAVTPAAPPGPPTNVTATPGNAQATVSWTAPASNGGSPITGYTVTSSPGGVTASAGASATSAVVTPLVNGTIYTFTVTVTNAVGTSSPSVASNPVTPAAPPGPPTSVTATGGNGQATVSWTPPASDGGSPITGYTLTSSPGGVTASAGAAATSAVVSPLANGTTYTFTVAASNAIGTSSASAPSNAVTPVAPPGAPTNVAASAANAQATVSWTAPGSSGGTPITGYTVTSSPDGVTATAGASATSAVVNPLVNGTSYTFTVTATNAAGTSNPSAQSNAVTPAAPPGPPPNVTATPGNAQATVSWTAPASNGGSPITGFTVSSSPGGVTASAGASATSAVISPLINGTSYTFTVTASNGIGTSSPSAASNAVTPVAPPGPPTNVAATAGDAQATVSWTAPANNGGSPITGYTVTSSPGGVVASAAASATSAVVGSLVNGTSYTFSVVAANAIGTSSPSAPSNAVTPATAPGSPTNVTATAGFAQASVNWTAPASNGGSAITGYTVTSSPGGVTASAGAGATSAVVTPLAGGTTYTFTVTASNAAGTSTPSAASNAVTPTTSTVPDPPTNVSAVAGNAQATVGWAAPASDGGSAITGYTVTSSPGGVTASVGASASSASVGPLVNGTTYTFTVTASNAVGTSSPSTPSNAVTPVTAPGPPTNVTATGGNGQATVSWTAPASNGGSPITGYTVTASPGGATASAGASATSTVVSPLANGTSYTFTVTATNAAGTSSPSTPSNSVTPATAPGTPTNVTATAGNAQATISWTPPGSSGGSPITGYTVTSAPGGVSASAGAAATSAVVTPLVNGTTYTFTVTASNAVGTSAASPPSNAVTPMTVPGPPINVTATPGNVQATVSWTAPASNGGSPITGYTVTSSPGGVTANAGAATTSAVVSPLLNGTSYTFTVTARNAAGTSTASVASNPVTPRFSQISTDQIISKDATGTAITSAFSTAGPGELLVAFATSDGPASGGQTLRVSGAGLTWTLAKRTNTRAGTAEIWSAFASSKLTGVTVTSTETKTGFDQSLTVLALTGASSVGAVGGANAASGAPTVTVTTTKPGSWVLGAGNDWDTPTARTLGLNQVLEHQWVDTNVGDTFWVQATNAQTANAGTAVQLNDTAPTTDRWNYAAVEVIAS